jgi:hypothetical protein
MLVGSIVHESVEKYWNNKLACFGLAHEKAKSFNLGDKSIEKIDKCLLNFFDKFAEYLTEEDLIEYSFKLELEKGIYLVGRMDRISYGNIFDWKTGTRLTRDLSTSVQFLIYQEAYRRVFGASPVSVYLGHLQSGTLVRLKDNKPLTNFIFHDIIPSIIEAIKKHDFYPEGIIKGSCRNCAFKKICHEELNYELESGIFNKE